MAPEDFSSIPGVAPSANDPNMSVDPNAIAPPPETVAAQPPPQAPAQQAQSVNNLTPDQLGMSQADQNTGFASAQGVVPPFDPKKVLQDPNASSQDKLHAMGVLKNQESDESNRMNAARVTGNAEIINRANAYDNELKARAEFNIEAKQRGVAEMPPPDMSQFGITPQQYAGTKQPEVQAESGPTADEIKRQDELKRIHDAAQDQAQKQNAALMGQAKAHDDWAKTQQNNIDMAINQLDKQQVKLDNIDPQRFWKNQSTGTKVMAGIALIFGGSNGLKNNPGLDLINNAVDQDIAAQKVNQTKALELKANALKRVHLEIEKFMAKSQDEYRKVEAKKALFEIDNQKQLLDQQRLNNAYLNVASSTGSGLTPEQARNMLTPEQLKSTVVLPNGNIMPTTNEESAKKLNAVRPIMLKLKDVVQRYNAELSKFSTLDKLTPQGLSQAKNNLTALKTMVVPLLKEATGVTGQRLNEDTYKRYDEGMVGDATSFFQNPKVIRQKGLFMQDLINSFEADNYRALGIKIGQDSWEHQYRKQLFEKGEDPQMIDKAIEKQKAQKAQGR